MLSAFERKMLYAFLTTLFQYPDEQTLEAVQGLEKETFEPLFPGLGVPTAPCLEELQTAYTGLFVNRFGGVPASPYGSVYLEKEPRVMGQSTLAVANTYTSAGLSLEQSNEPADYLPTELEFLYYLTEGEERSLEEKTKAKTKEWIASQADFFHILFYPWITQFCQKLADTERAHPFYLWAADLLGRFAEMENQRLKEIKPGK